jgi:hypothetical protein
VIGFAQRQALTLAVGAAVFALAFESGGYSLTTRNSVAIAVWWAAALAVALSLLPLLRPTRAAIVSAGLLAGFAGLTALSAAWADSAERAFAEFNRVALYLGVLVLVVLTGTRANLRSWRDGIALGIAATALLALTSRLFPNFVDQRDLFGFLPDSEQRLSYPLDYWNGLGIFTGLAFPLLLGIGVGARSALARGLAVASMPALAATVYLTASRGGAATAIVGSVVFVALTSRRIAALGTLVCAAAGSAAVVTILLARSELVDGPLHSAAAADQGRSAAFLIALVCLLAGTIVVVASRFAPRPAIRLGAAAKGAIALAAVAVAVAGIVAIDPVQRVRTFEKRPDEFKQAQTDFTRAHLLSGSGSGRWQFWQAATDEFQTRPMLGRGAGSYEAWWAAHGSLFRFVRDAHSLYLETLGELGLVGFALLLGALGTGLISATSRLRASRGGDRIVIASLVALLLAWCFGAGIDWMWELTVVTVVAIACLGLLTGPATTRVPAREPDALELRAARSGRLGGRALWARAGFATVAVAAIVTQGIPLVAQTRIRDSQAAAARGDARAALDKARDAHDLQPWASSPDLQLALVEEQTGDLVSAHASIIDAIDNDRSDWRLWLVRARIETKSGSIDQARESLHRTRELNPRSPLFASR